MNTNWELIQWFKRMGYDGEIPKSLENIYNQSTSFIWDELVQTAKPKQEVDNLRNNIILHRLRSKQLCKQDEFPYPVKEIDVYIKKQDLNKKLGNLNSTLEEKKHKLNNLSQSNKMKYITIEKLKTRIKENRERKCLLGKRCNMLEKNIQEAEETLSFAKNLTPVELEENPNTKEITETLEKCAEKLEKLLPDIPQPSHQLNSTHKSFRLFQSAMKPPKTQTTFEKYLIMSESKQLKQGVGTTRKDQSSKENLAGAKKINKKLFDTSSERHNKTGKRESLGLLSDSCFNADHDDRFLEAPEPDHFLSSTLFTLNEISMINPNATKSEMLNAEISSQPLCYAQKHNSFDKVYNDGFVTNTLKNLLYNHNRHVIWKTFQTLNDNLNMEFAKNIIFEAGKADKGRSISQDDIAKLQFLHVRTEVQILKLKNTAIQLSNKVNKKKQGIYAALAHQGASQEKIEDIQRLLEQQLEDVGLDAVLAKMKKEINSAKKIEDSSDLQVTLRKILQAKNDIDLKVASIKYYVNGIHETLKSMVRTRETTVACVQKLGPFVEDLSWSEPLTQNLCSNEIKTFERFPLEYNRRCIHTNPRIFYRDIADNIPSDIDLDSESLYMLTNILESPFSPPEAVLLNILKSKMKLDALKSLQSYSTNISYTKYSLKELEAQESYVQYALDKLNSLIYSTSSIKTLATADFVKKVMEIWLEMPLKDFISPKRAVKGKDYKYYEKHYDSFYNNF